MTFINKIKKKIIFETNHKSFCLKKVNNSYEIFDKNIIDFLDNLSGLIFREKKIKDYPDLATFAFFCRKSNINSLKKKYSNFLDNRYGRGLVLHFAPSNVPLNFAYSLLFGLITGNTNIVRLSDNFHTQETLLIKNINNLLKKKFRKLQNKINLIRYKKSEDITAFLSSICDVRVIWGGDQSVNEIRKQPLSPEAYDVTFADRYSICLVSAKNYLEAGSFDKEAIAFYNDTMVFDQNACTSPKIVLWHGNIKDINKAKFIFWKKFNKLLHTKNYKTKGNLNYEKLYKQTKAIIDLNLKKEKEAKSIVKKINIKKIPKNLDQYLSSGGFFMEFNFKRFNEIKNLFSSKIQTLTYIGLEPLIIKKKLNLTKIKSVDRIVPNGRSSEMGLEWDGYDIAFQLSKKLTII